MPLLDFQDIFGWILNSCFSSDGWSSILIHLPTMDRCSTRVWDQPIWVMTTALRWTAISISSGEEGKWPNFPCRYSFRRTFLCGQMAFTWKIRNLVCGTLRVLDNLRCICVCVSGFLGSFPCSLADNRLSGACITCPLATVSWSLSAY